MVFVVPVAFFLYHCAYGLGTAYGFFRPVTWGPRARAIPYVPGVLRPVATGDHAARDVTIIIPCRNESRFIGRCLDSVLSMDFGGHSWELLVIDGCSTDGTVQMVSEYCKRDSRVRLLSNPLQATAPALNIGLAHASGEWIIRLDAHARYEPDYLRECLRVARESGADAVGGTCIAEVSQATLGAQLVRAITTDSFGVGSSRFRTSTKDGPADTVLFGCYRRSLFAEVGIWDERLSTGSEDFELNQRIRNSGHTLWFSPRIRTHYFNKSGLGEFLFKVLKRDGPCNPWMWYLWPSAFRIRHAIPMCFAAVLAATAAGCWWKPVPFCVLALTYLSAAMLASARQACRYHQWRLALLAPVAFLLYHLAYGIGGWYGVYQLLLGRAPVSPGNIRPVSYTELHQESFTQ
jgi:glycosyltransferase involved in cell wall biosynthesis